MAEKRPSRLLLSVPVLLLVSAFGVMGRMVPASPRERLPVPGEGESFLAAARVTTGGPAVTMMPGRIGYAGPVQPGACQFNIVLHDGHSNSTAVLPAYVWDHRRAVTEGVAVPAPGRSVTRSGFVVTNTGRTVCNRGGGVALPVLQVRALPGVSAGTYHFQFAPSFGAPCFQTFAVVAGGLVPDR